jgi:hypothetical protein
MSKNQISFEDTGMFAMIPHSFIKEAKLLKVHTRWLYVALVFYRNNKSGVAFPSYDTIQELTGLSRRMISKGLTELEKSGWIKPRSKRFGNSNVYRVVLNKEGKKFVKKQDSSNVSQTR